MDFELEKLLAKASGENIENMAARAISETDKTKIVFAFSEMFSGFSVLEWLNGCVLREAWMVSLDKMRDYIFSIPENGYVVDYLRKAVFEYRTKTLKMLTSSEHSNEYIRCSQNERIKLEDSAKEKIKNAANIIYEFIAAPSGTANQRKKQYIDKQRMPSIEYEYEYERVKK